MRTVRIAAPLLASLALAGMVGLADAQSLGKIARKTGLTPEDFNILGETARGLYDRASPPVGRIVSWSNPDSGSHGTVRLAAMRKNCAYIQHFIYSRGEPPAWEMRTQWCRAEDGRWLLQP